MQIERLELQNFKCFEKLEMDFGKITLLTGANSSGKSSIIYALLGMLQSEEFPFQYSPNGKFVNMGDYKEMVFQQDLKKDIHLNLRCEINNLKYNFKTIWENEEIQLLPSVKKSEQSYDLTKLSLSKIDKELYAFEVKNKQNEFQEEVKIKDFISEYFYFAYDASLEKWPDMTQALAKGKWPDMTQALLGAPNFNNANRLFNFINPSQIPKRTSYEITQGNLKVGIHGEGFADQIIQWQTRSDPKLKELIGIMKDLKLFHIIKSVRLGGGRYELRVEVHKNGLDAALNDVGFGTSQFLPIVVADLQLPNDSTLMVAQPEVHLHPSVQAEFGSYLVKQALEKNKRYIIETHSEYLFNRIRLHIVQGDIKPEDVKMYYLQNDGQGTKCHLLEFTKDGQIKNAPKDFFDTYLMDTMDIALNAIK